ncbi:MAG: hypothetical protein ACF8R9_14250 [Phycisphaerales bacterium JB054]
MPESRQGSPWQRGPSVWSWLGTVWLVLAHPQRMSRTIGIGVGGVRRLQAWNVAAASVVVGLCFGYAQARFHLLESLGLSRANAGAQAAFVGVVATIGAFVLVSGLTAIERLGIRFFGRVHKARVTECIARALTAHASAAWLAGAVLMAAGLAVGTWAHEEAMAQNVGAGRGPMMLSPALLALLGGFLGMLWFETIVYLGLRGCRFANRARPEP